MVKQKKNVFGAKLRSLREKADKTQQELADAAGLAKETVYLLEKGRREPTWATVQAIATALGVDYEEFVEPAGKK